MSEHDGRAKFPLYLPYAVIGAAGGWMAADFFRVGALRVVDSGLRTSLAVVTPLFALALGLFLAPLVRSPGRIKAFAFVIVAVLSAGLMAGGLVGVLRWSKWGLGEGAATGFLCSLAFLPAFALVFAAARRVGRARPGSIVDRADKRAVWLAAATSVAAGTLAALPDWNVFPSGLRPSLEVSRNLGLAAVAMIAALWLSDLVALVRAHLLERQVDAMRPASPDDPRLVWAPRRVDLGLGDTTLAAVLSAAVTYRDHERFISVVRGDPMASRRALLGTFASGFLALVVAGTCLVATGSSVAQASPSDTARAALVAR